MRSKEEILSEVLDSLIRHEDGRTPPEIVSLANIGARLHNECPDADPAFLQRLQQRLQAEWALPSRAQLLLAALTGWLPRPSRGLLRTAAGTLVAAGLLLALVAWLPGLEPVQASLSRAITLFRQARIEQGAEPASTPLAPPEVRRTFSDVEEARAAGLDLRTPTYLPAGLALTNVIALEDGAQERVVLQYADLYSQVGPGREHVTIQEFRVGEGGEATLTLQWNLSDIERLDVAGRTALWIPHPQNSGGSPAGQQYGDVLLVQDDDILIQLFGSLSRDETVRIAESMFR